jgi:hypothetical protein
VGRPQQAAHAAGDLPGTDSELSASLPARDQAVALAEQLCDDTGPGAPVFGRFGFPERYHSFRTWVNGPAGQRLGLNPIPEGIVNPRRLRRILSA